jgi:omega-6 fatty acid desaturase (delta-12 desaturase)
MSFTREELRNFHRRSFILGTAIFLLDFAAFAAASIGAVVAQSPFLQFGLAVLAGLMIGALHVVGHDACHQNLTPSRWLNRVLGTLSFLPGLYAYSLWELAHNRNHHRFTNIRGRDYVWEPLTPREYERLSPSAKRRYRFYRTFAGHFWYGLFEIWLKKLFFPRPSEIGGYRRIYVVDLAIVTAWLILWPLALFAIRSGTVSTGSGDDLRVAVAVGLAVPFLTFKFLNSPLIFLNHTHPRVGWFTMAQAPKIREVALVSTVHVIFPAPINWLFHRIMEHTAHHVRPDIPLYHLMRSQTVLEERHPEVVVERWTLASHLRILRTCKLYDIEARCWTGYDGVPTTTATDPGLVAGAHRDAISSKTA